jgi:hypothetical protein
VSKEGNFLIYCLERYRHFKGLSGEEVTRKFEQYDLYDYVIKYFESLHTMGDLAIVQDIDAFIAESNKGI